MTVTERQALLDAATPRPWRVEGGFTPLHGPATPEGYTDIIWAYDDANYVFRNSADEQLVVAAVNEYEHLLACEAGLRALVGFLRPDNRHALHAREALEALDDVRRTA